MNLILAAALFPAGVYLGIRTIAAFYGMLDLWYVNGARRARLVLRAGVWAGLTTGLAVILPSAARIAVLAGFVAFALFYTAAALAVSRVVYPRLVRRIRSGG